MTVTGTIHPTAVLFWFRFTVSRGVDAALCKAIHGRLSVNPSFIVHVRQATVAPSMRSSLMRCSVGARSWGLACRRAVNQAPHNANTGSPIPTDDCYIGGSLETLGERSMDTADMNGQDCLPSRRPLPTAGASPSQTVSPSFVLSNWGHDAAVGTHARQPDPTSRTALALHGGQARKEEGDFIADAHGHMAAKYSKNNG